MRSVLRYSIWLLLIACNRRSDVVFSASDDFHYLSLYKQNNAFEMMYNGLNTVAGQYQWRNDTLFLTYGETEYLGTAKEGKSHANTVLARRLVVDRKRKSLHLLDGKGMQFCVGIGFNELK